MCNATSLPDSRILLRKFKMDPLATTDESSPAVIKPGVGEGEGDGDGKGDGEIPRSLKRRRSLLTISWPASTLALR